ncbi:hypothetical protein Pelo_8644 [Pelomyxa schiedti]|nr:hypothetical protein Pelo_8644 [Pelomyxa schiedti]
MGRSSASDSNNHSDSDDSKDSDWEENTSKRKTPPARAKTGTRHRGKKVVATYYKRGRATAKKIPASNKHDTDSSDDYDDEIESKLETGNLHHRNVHREETCDKGTRKGNGGGRKYETGGAGDAIRSKGKSKGKANHSTHTIGDEDISSSSDDGDGSVLRKRGLCAAEGDTTTPTDKAKRPKLGSERPSPPRTPLFKQNLSSSSSCSQPPLSEDPYWLTTPKYKILQKETTKREKELTKREKELTKREELSLRKWQEKTKYMEHKKEALTKQWLLETAPHGANTSMMRSFSECASVIANATVIPFFPGITALHVHWNPSKKWEKVKGASEAELYPLLNKSIEKWEQEISKKQLPVPNQLHDVHTTKVILQDRKPDYVFCLRGKPICSFYTTFILEVTSDEGGSFPSNEYKGRAVDHATKFLDAVPMRTQIWVGVTNLRFIWFLRATRGSGTQKEFCTGAICAPVAPELLKVLNLSEEDLTGVSLSHSYKMADDPIVIHGRAGEGATSLVMLCSISRPHTEAKYILKIAKKGEESYLQDENRILRHFVGLGIQGVPKTLGLTNGDNAMLIEPIGRSILDPKVLCLIINNIPLLFSEVVKTLEAVHTKGMYVHRDVRPENILLDSSTGKNRLILIDWGFAKSTPCNSEEGFCGTVHWASDSVLRQLSARDSLCVNYEPQDDLVSLVRSLITLLDLCEPFSNPKLFQVLKVTPSTNFEQVLAIWDKVLSATRGGRSFHASLPPLAPFQLCPCSTTRSSSSPPSPPPTSTTPTTSSSTTTTTTTTTSTTQTELPEPHCTCPIDCGCVCTTCLCAASCLSRHTWYPHAIDLALALKYDQLAQYIKNLRYTCTSTPPPGTVTVTATDRITNKRIQHHLGTLQMYAIQCTQEKNF